MVKYSISENNLHIYESCTVPKAKFGRNLTAIKVLHPDSEVWERSMCSLKMEWGTHNFLYSLGLWKSHTAEVDLNYPQKWYMNIAYCIVGAIGWIFIK